ASRFFFQAEDGIRDFHVTGVQTCALPILCPTSLESDCARKQRLVVRYLCSSCDRPDRGAPGAPESATRNEDSIVSSPRTPFAARSEERRVGKEGRAPGRRPR